MSDEKRPITLAYVRALKTQNIEYETVLLYIHLPQVPPPRSEISKEQPSKKQISKKQEPTNAAASDVKRYTDVYLKVFEWLKWIKIPKDGKDGERRVQKVVKVIVDDFGHVSHSESAISEALKGLDIEELDWKRADVGSETIFEGAPMVKILNLYWGGSRGILKGWSCEDGLCKLKNVSFHITWRS
jgi:hypothetical protein